MTKDAPRILYKYASWDKEFHKKLLTHKEIFFPSALKFNDPFDSDIQFRIDLREEKDNLDVIKQVIMAKAI